LLLKAPMIYHFTLQVHVESSSVISRNSANGTQYLIDIKLTVDMVSRKGGWSRCMMVEVVGLTEGLSNTLRS